MLTSKSFNKLTRRGKLLKVLREHYLRDDIPCGASSCTACAGADVAAASVVTAGAAGLITSVHTWLSSEPRDGVIIIPDTNILLHQMDVLEAAGTAMTDVVVLQTVLGETRHRHMGTYSRLLAVLRDSTRRFVPFANEHHPETYADRIPGETANDYSDRLVRKAAAWLALHYKPLRFRVLLLTDDAENSRRAREEHQLSTSTMREYVATLASAADDAAAGGGLKPDSTNSGFLSRLADLVASRQDSPAGEGVNVQHPWQEAPSTVAASSSSSSSAEPTTTQPASEPRRPDARSTGSRLTKAPSSLYREHWPPSRIAAAVKSRSAFQGTLRVNRECWYEARVAIHGVLSGRARSEGERLAMGGGEDVVSVLISGRDAINRAMEGDTVVIQLLPKSQWKHPSIKLAVSNASSAAEAAGEEDGEGGAAGEPAPSKPAAEGGELPDDDAAGTGSRVLTPTSDGVTDDADSSVVTAADLRHAVQSAALAGSTGAADSATNQDGGMADVSYADGTFTRDAGHDSAVDELRKAAAKAAVLGSAGSGKPSSASVLPGGVVPTGRVVGIVKRAWRHYCGSLQLEEEAASSSSATPSGVVTGSDGSGATSSALFVPIDPKVPRIRIDTRQKASLMDKRLVVAVDGWGQHDRYPRGHYVRTIGPIGDRASETEVILLEHDIPFRPFSSDVLACLPSVDWVITPGNSVGRTDLRGVPVCSVDPPGCKDIDDALHARWGVHPDTGGPVVEVGVHIADVTYFVRPGTAIDLEAAARANTTYLVERRLDMLPGLLTETLCSLKGGVDRFAFSVTWLFEPTTAPGSALRVSVPSPGDLPCDGKGVLACGWAVVPGSVRYFKSIIHSQAAMTYGAAQALLDADGAPTPVAAGIKLLASIARSLRSSRKDAGALTLASPEVRFQLDSETHDPIDVAAYELKETNSMVEEFMLLANIWTAKRTQAAFPRYAMLRRHPAPPRSQFDSLLAAAAAVGVPMGVETSRALADSLDAAVVAGNPYFNKLLRILATRCMMQAVYFPSGEVSEPEYAHYGLATPIYTHFTSPIRRYADVVVHRLLASALEIDPLPTTYEDLGGMRKLCDNMNKRHLMSQLAGRASGSLHTNLFFKNRVVIESGLVIRVRANGVALLVPRFGLEGVVILGRPAGEGTAAGSAILPLLKPSSGTRESAATAAGRLLSYDEAAQTVCDAAQPDALTLRIFDEVRVALVVEERARFRKELVLRVIDPPFHALPFPRDAPPPGITVEDATGGRPLANAVTLAAKQPPSAAAPEGANGAGSRKVPREGGQREAAQARSQGVAAAVESDSGTEPAAKRAKLS